jgi:GNAT superfamily N-acetyltransferase
MNAIVFRKAEFNDLLAMMRIVGEAQRAIKSLEIDQWQNGYPSEDIISEDIRNGYSYILENEESVIGMATVIFNYEPTYNKIFDGEWLSTGQFVVVHRMAIAESFKKQGFASVILQKVEDLAKEKSIPSFKIDTHEGNIPMRKTVERHGFTKCGIIFLKNGNRRIAYEKLI